MAAEHISQHTRPPQSVKSLAHNPTKQWSAFATLWGVLRAKGHNRLLPSSSLRAPGSAAQLAGCCFGSPVAGASPLQGQTRRRSGMRKRYQGAPYYGSSEPGMPRGVERTTWLGRRGPTGRRKKEVSGKEWRLMCFPSFFNVVLDVRLMCRRPVLDVA